MPSRAGAKRLEGMLAEGGIGYKVWLSLTWQTKTGRNLLRIFPNDVVEDTSLVVFANATPKVGHGSHSNLYPDAAHIANLLEEHRPGVVLTCGKNALDGLLRAIQSELTQKLITMPHPAARFLTASTPVMPEVKRLLLAPGDWVRWDVRQDRNGQLVSCRIV